ncbi:MAG: MASE3 domain-containing protein [Candidatus Aminicenantes bacterium]|jgi:hypothetical protein
MKKRQISINYLGTAMKIFVLLGLCLTQFYSYLLFHSLVEIFSIIIGCGIFMLAWNSRNLIEKNYILFLGIAYLCIASLDLVHTLAYSGMGIFPGYNANLPTQLWISARYIESLSLLIMPLFFNRQVNIPLVSLGYIVVGSFFLAAIFLWDIFPDCFVATVGLTPFKKISEYIISGILLLSIYVLFRKRDQLDTYVLHMLTASVILTVFSELSFTFYKSPYGIANLIGHLLKLVSFYLIYKAIIVTGCMKPYALLFRNLKKNEEELRQALDKVKTLKGIIPICSRCKKIRDDTGYWQQVETYIEEHSDADFSHSLCWECAKELYPELSKSKETV